MRRKCEGLSGGLQEQTDLAASLRTELASHSADARSLERLQAKLQRLEQERCDERAELQRAVDKYKKEVPTHAPRP